MSLYDRDYMKSGRTDTRGSTRRPGFIPVLRRSPSHRLNRLQAVGFVMGATAIIMLVLGMALT